MKRIWLIIVALLFTSVAVTVSTPDRYAQAEGTNITFPVTAAFYYPWFPETWSVNRVHVKYQPTNGYYSSDDAIVVANHMAALDYAHVNVAIASWWGQNTHNEAVRIKLMLDKAAATGVKVAFYYEKEGNTINPTQAEITADLNYLQDTYGSHPGAATVNGKIVVFVYNANDLTCAIADKWKAANTIGAYIDLKVFSGYRTCTSQPNSWHQYSPASATGTQGSFMYAVSPGYWRADEATPRLARDLTRWQANVSSMKASTANWHLITTFNEWGEGSAVESANEWSSASGYGKYVDVLHDTLTPPVPTTTTTTTIGVTTTTYPAKSEAERIAAPLSNAELKALIDQLNIILTNRTATTTTVAATTTTTTTVTPTTSTTIPAATTTSSTNTTTTIPNATQSVVVGAGDICKIATISDPTKTGQTIQGLINSVGAYPITLGDNQYDAGAFVDFQACYDKAWGSFKAQTHPAIGNHDLGTPNAAGYFQYFGASAGTSPLGYYSWTIDANWVAVSLNSEITGTPMTNQLTWLSNFLKANPTKNVLAYMHEPVASSGQHGASARARQLWDVMYPLGVDIVLAGHDHEYEQFDLLGANPATTSPTGVKFFVVGTGGANHTTFLSTIQPGSITRNQTTFGVLKLTLRKSDYDFAFLANSPSSFTDTGHGVVVR